MYFGLLYVIKIDLNLKIQQNMNQLVLQKIQMK